MSDAELLGNLPLRYTDGHDYCEVKDCTDGAFALTVQPELMQLMERSAVALPALVKALEAFESATITPGGAIVGLMREDFGRARSAIAAYRGSNK